MHVKHEKIKRLKHEMSQLKAWYDMGLVPKSKEEQHLQEIQDLEAKINEEKQRLALLKDEQSMAEQNITQGMSVSVPLFNNNNNEDTTFNLSQYMPSPTEDVESDFDADIEAFRSQEKYFDEYDRENDLLDLPDSQEYDYEDSDKESVKWSDEYLESDDGY